MPTFVVADRSDFRVLEFKRQASDAPGSGQHSHPRTQAPNHNQRGPKSGEAFDKAQTPDPLAEFDEYGTELHKDARVWKVYVNEADKNDTELVNGWNESTDVILIFAALFSAISTAFLIESTKLLKPDPAEQSAQSLLSISETLSAIANGTQPLGAVGLPSSNPAEFTPSRAALCVNVLWYLSLGLSLATSFIVILAKDWCHSFMSGRTGHPYSQTCRRQRKWNMIEKWKMSELLAILPSLIHVALLLFSVGLCIYLFDTYIAVAIPIFCATGAAIGFYVWSSITAIHIDYFPYPTVVSRVCRADTTGRAARAILVLVCRFGSHPVLRNIYQTALMLVFAGVWVLRKFLYIPMILCFLPAVLEEPLDECDTYLMRSPPLLQLVAVPLSKFFRYLVWFPANAAAELLRELGAGLDSIRKSIKSQLSVASWGLEWLEWVPKPASQVGNDNDTQDDITGLALSWLITNCEDPQSVDIALQSIAGATSRTPRQPLLDCHATLEILRRLASSNLYKGSGVRTDMIISLYSRALAQLGNAAGTPPGTERNGSRGELEGLVWDVHLESERRVAASIVSGGFDPTPANLGALRIGSTAASNTLKLLGRDSQKTNVDIDKILDSIVTQLKLHVSHSERLHYAALLSLVNATALLLPFAPDCSAVTSLGSLCASIIGPQFDALTPSSRLLVNIVVICASMSNKRMSPEMLDRPNSRSLLEGVMGKLVECYAEETAAPAIKSMFGLEMLATHPEAFKLTSLDSSVRDAMLNIAASGIRVFYDFFFWMYPGGAGFTNMKDEPLWPLRAIQSPLNLIPAERSYTITPFFILGPIRLLWMFTTSPVADEWAMLASDSRFPVLSQALAQLVEQSDLVSHLDRMIETGYTLEQFIALGQLWLLFTINLDASSDLSNERERLGVQLQKYNHNHPENEHVRHTQIGDQLVFLWESGGVHSPPLGGWPARLMECVYQSRNSQPPESVYTELREYNIPADLRGLSSFTSWRPQSINPETCDIPQLTNDTHIAAHDENSNDNDQPATDTGRGRTGNEAGDTGATICINVGNGGGAVCEGRGSENPAYGTMESGEMTKSEGDPITREGQQVGDLESITSRPKVEPGDAGNVMDGKPHVFVDIHASDEASK